MATDSWTALVVEDEPRLREALVDHLRHASFTWHDILQAGDAEEALALCQSHHPQVAFLDIRLPGISGLELASRLPEGIRIVFVTAYDAHAIEAFEAGAVDYLLKPITSERLQKTLDRIQERAPISVEALLKRLGNLASPPLEPLQWITASSGRRTHWIPVDEVLFFQADSKYIRVECRGASYVIDHSIKDLVARLDPKMFQQVHRSTVVNLRAVAWVEKQDGGGGRIHLREHSAVIPVSASYMKELKER
ncbi:MAG: LytTR family DNA-binding domain-containing protein [Holophaga sp.]|nr:LytTR family DNA-binding domain-containing protein [Holophaga sp.]